MVNSMTPRLALNDLLCRNDFDNEFPELLANCEVDQRVVSLNQRVSRYVSTMILTRHKDTFIPIF